MFTKRCSYPLFLSLHSNAGLKAIAEIKAHNLTGDLKNIPIFYGRGAWDEKRMKFMDRALSRMLHRLIAKKDPGTYELWMEALMCAYGKSCNWTDKNKLPHLPTAYFPRLLTVLTKVLQ